MINDIKQPMCYYYELYMDAVIELADGTDYHTPVTAHVYAIDGVEALKVWMAEAPDDLLMKHGLFVVSRALQKRLDDMGAANRAHQAAEAAKRLAKKRSDAAKKAAATRRANKAAAAQSVGA